MADFEDDIKNKNSLSSSKGSELLSVRENKLENISVQEKHILERIAKDKSAAQSIMSQNPGDKEFEAQRAQSMIRLGARVNELEKLLSAVEGGRVHGANKSFQQSVNTSLNAASTSSDIASIARSSTSFGAAVSTARSMPTTSIEESIKKNKQLLEKQTNTVREHAKNVDNNKDTFIEEYAKRDKIIEQIGKDEAALGVQKKLGIDTKSQYYRASEVVDRIKQEKERSQTQSDIKEGRFGDRKQIDEQLNSISEKLVQTFEQLNQALSSAPEKVDGLSRELENLTKDHERFEKARAGIGGGDGRNTANSFIRGAGMVGDAMQGAAGAYRYAEVGSEIARDRNRIGLAEIANQRFGDVYGATKGDASALRRVLTDQYATDMSRGREFRGKTDAAMLTATTGAGISTFAGVAGSVMAGNLGGAVSSGISGGLNTVNTGIDYGKNISAVQDQIAGYQTNRELNDTISKISDQSSQTAISHLMNLTRATRGLGSGRDAAQNQLMDPQNIASLAQVGIGLEDIPGLVGASKSALGRVENIHRAGEITRSGVLDSSEQYFQARGMMTGAGGSGANLENILKNAVANGMDNSKNILEMVQATTALADRSSTLGVSTFAGAQTGIEQAVNFATAHGVDKNMAVRGAALAAQTVEDISTNKDFNIQNIIRAAQIRSAFPSATAPQMFAMSQMTPDKLRTLETLNKTGTQKQFDEASIGFGVYGALGNSKESRAASIKELENQNVDRIINEMAGVGLNKDMANNLRKKMRSGGVQSLTKEEISAVNSFGMMINPKVSGIEMLAGMDYTGKIKTETGTLRDTANNGERALAAGAQSEAKMFGAGIDNMKKSPLDGIENLGKVMEKIAARMNPAEFARSAKDAADSLSAPIDVFAGAAKLIESAADKLDKAADKFNGIETKSNTDTSTRGKQNLKGNVNQNQTKASGRSASPIKGSSGVHG